MSIGYTADKERQHDGKRTYLTSSQAKRAAKHTMTMHGGSKMTAYRCPWCSLYHIGHPAQWRKHAAATEASA